MRFAPNRRAAARQTTALPAPAGTGTGTAPRS